MSITERRAVAEHPGRRVLPADLVARYALTAAAAENLCRFTECVANRVADRLYLHARERDDVLAAGYQGLIQALDNYDASRGTRLETHVYRKVLYAIADDTHRWDHRCRSDREWVRGRRRQEPEAELPWWASHRPVLFGEGPPRTAAGPGGEGVAVTDGPEQIYDAWQDRLALRLKLHTLLTELAPIEAEVVRRSFLEEEDDRTIGRALSLSVNGVAVIRDRALARLRELSARVRK